MGIIAGVRAADAAGERVRDADVITATTAEGTGYLARARAAIAAAGLPREVASGLRDIADSIEGSLVRHGR